MAFSQAETALIAAKAKEDTAGKQAALASGTNIKTLNGISLLGSGDLPTFVSKTISVDTTLPAGYFGYFGGCVEIASGKTFEIGSGATLEIG